MNFKKITALAVASVIGLAAFGGCSSDTQTDTYDELTIFMYDMNTPFKDDYPIYKEAERMTGVHLRGTIPPSVTDYQSAFELMLAAGNLADIVHTSVRQRFVKYGREGVFIPLNNLIENHAPNLKKVLEERLDVREFITAPDGNIYFIPFIPDGTASEGWFIRKDWLEKLGLSVPANVHELHDVMLAIRNGDPNGNGKQDEIPYFNRNHVQGVNYLYSFWGMNGDIFAENGTVKYSPLCENFLEATETIATWYSEGLIDPEIYTRGPDSREYMLSENIGGITHDWFASSGIYNQKFSEKICGFDFSAIAPPAGVDGVIREFTRRKSVDDVGWAISSANKNPEKTMEWIDFWFSPEGNRLMNYGVEGEDYILEGGKPVFTKKALSSSMAVTQYLQARGGQGNVPFVQDFEYEKQWMDPATYKSMTEYAEGGYFTEQYTAPLLSESEQAEYEAIMNRVTPLYEAQIKRWILGTENVRDNYDAFIAEIKAMGIERAIEILNNNYSQ